MGIPEPKIILTCFPLKFDKGKAGAWDAGVQHYHISQFAQK